MIAKKTIRLEKIGNMWISTQQNGHRISIQHHSKTAGVKSALTRNPKAIAVEMTFYYPDNEEGKK